MAELKPCPFCGGVATQVFSVNAETYVYGCYTNGCMGNALNQLHRYDTDKEAIEAWNRRAENEELRFTRQFIHEQGLEFALADAWNRRAEDG